MESWASRSGAGAAWLRRALDPRRTIAVTSQEVGGVMGGLAGLCPDRLHLRLLRCRLSERGRGEAGALLRRGESHSEL